MVEAAVSPEVVGESRGMKFLKKYQSPGRAKKPVKLIGGKGSGKTTLAMQFALTQPFEQVVVMQGDVGMDAQQMRGGIRPYPEGGATTTVWQDGELAEAFRYAQAGKTVCFYTDELYRIKATERSPLISGLSPIRYPDGIWYYIVKTGRIMSVNDGLVTGSEVIKAPCHLISIIASTNAGAGYDIQAADPAEADRWLEFDMESTEESVKHIVGIVLKEAGMDARLTPKFVKLLQDGIRLRVDNLLEHEPNVRILCDGIKLAKNEMDLGNTLMDVALVWVGRSIEGKRIPEQLDQLRNLINTHFPIHPSK
jgi:hypothetical protein